jgi:uncharacterized protein YndB with AHSA1/START domain
MSTATVSPKVATHELHITRVFEGPRELVWKMWTDPEHLKRWMGPRGFEALHLQMDLRPRGRWRQCLHSDGFDRGDGELRKLDLWQGGEYREVVEPERLVYSYKWDEDTGLHPQETVVTILFRELEGKTAMDFRQAFFLAEKDRDGHVHGWSSSLDKLDDYLREVQAREGRHGER